MKRVYTPIMIYYAIRHKHKVPGWIMAEPFRQVYFSQENQKKIEPQSDVRYGPIFIMRCPFSKRNILKGKFQKCPHNSEKKYLIFGFIRFILICFCYNIIWLNRNFFVEDFYRAWSRGIQLPPQIVLKSRKSRISILVIRL